MQQDPFAEPPIPITEKYILIDAKVLNISACGPSMKGTRPFELRRRLKAPRIYWLNEGSSVVERKQIKHVE